MKDPYIKIRLSELTRLNNRITLLEQRLREYEPPAHEVKLLNTDGSPANNPRVVHPLRKPGPSSVLEDMPDTFTADMVISHGGTKGSIRLWKWRKYITQDGDKYTKTEVYKERLRQARLTNVSNEFLVNKTAGEAAGTVTKTIE